MTDKELMETLHKAADAQDSIALSLLLRIAADRIGELANESL